MADVVKNNFHVEESLSHILVPSSLIPSEYIYIRVWDCRAIWVRGGRRGGGLGEERDGGVTFVEHLRSKSVVLLSFCSSSSCPTIVVYSRTWRGVFTAESMVIDVSCVGSAWQCRGIQPSSHLFSHI